MAGFFSLPRWDGWIGRSSAAAVLLAVSAVVSAIAQQTGAQDIHGIVRNTAGQPVSGALVRLQHEGAPALETQTDAEGSFALHPATPGPWVLLAEKDRLKSEPRAVKVGPPAGENLILTVGSVDAASSSADAMEFADKPNFTIAAVSDWTAAGGHGSDAVLRTSEALNREAVGLRPAQNNSAESTAEWKQAESTLRAAVARAPQAAEANHKLGEFYLRAEKFDQAVPPLETAYKFDSDNFENEYDLALALKGNGQYAAARDHIGKLFARRDTADLHRLKGEVDENLGDPLNAVHEFERAVRLDPSEQNYFAWGSELLLHRAVWQAKEVFSAAVKAYPKSERLLTALGASLFAGALYDEAAERLCEASDLNPADPEPYKFMGKVGISAPNPLPCIEQKLARFMAQRPADPLANYFYAMALWKQKGTSGDSGTAQRVQELLNNAVTLDPKCSQAYLQLGVLEFARRDFQKAIGFYSKALEANPELSDAHYRLGVAYDRAGERDKAAEQFRLHDEIEKLHAAEVDRQRREVKQFVVKVDGNAAR